jgi:ABC-type uncharacterized transport system permease subunit
MSKTYREQDYDPFGVTGPTTLWEWLDAKYPTPLRVLTGAATVCATLAFITAFGYVLEALGLSPDDPAFAASVGDHMLWGLAGLLAGAAGIAVTHAVGCAVWGGAGLE